MQQYVTRASGYMTADDFMLVETVLFPPRIQKQIGIAGEQFSLCIANYEFVLLKLANYAADKPLVNVGCLGQFALRPGPLVMHQQPASQASALGGENRSWPASLLESVGLSQHIDANAWRKDAGIAGEVEPCHPLRFAAFLPRFAHERDHQQRHYSFAQFGRST